MEESIGLKRVYTVLFTYSMIMKQCVFMRKCDLDIYIYCQRQMKSDAEDILPIIIELVQKIYSVFIVFILGFVSKNFSRLFFRFLDSYSDLC